MRVEKRLKNHRGRGRIEPATVPARTDAGRSQLPFGLNRRETFIPSNDRQVGGGLERGAEPERRARAGAMCAVQRYGQADNDPNGLLTPGRLDRTGYVLGLVGALQSLYGSGKQTGWIGNGHADARVAEVEAQRA